MKRYRYIAFFALTILILFVLFQLLSPKSDSEKVKQAIHNTSESFYLISSSSFQTNSLETVCRQNAMEQELSLSIHSCESTDSSLNSLDDLSGLLLMLSSTSNNQYIDGSYALQYSAMPLCKGNYTYIPDSDTLSISSDELWKGAIQIPMSDFGSLYQTSTLKDFFPWFSIDSSLSLSKLGNILQGNSLKMITTQKLEQAYKTCTITALPTQVIPLADHNSNNDWDYYEVAVSDDMNSLLQVASLPSIISPVTIAINSEGFLSYLDMKFANNMECIISNIDTHNSSCHIQLSEGTFLFPNIQTDLSFSCKQQQFQVTATDFSLEMKVPYTDEESSSIIWDCKASYLLSPSDSDKPSVSGIAPDYPVFTMNHDELQSLENEIWDNISQIPQLNMIYQYTK